MTYPPASPPALQGFDPAFGTEIEVMLTLRSIICAATGGRPA